MGDGLMRRAVIVFCFLVQFVVANAAGAAAPTGESLQIQRLIHLCKLWGTVRYLHPYLFYKDIDWDAALVAAIPKVSAAKTTDEYATALRDLLAVLHDPVTQIGPEELDEQSQTRPHTTEQPKLT